MVPQADTAALVAHITKRLEEAQRLRKHIHADPLLEQDRRVVRSWQAERMARTYADLLAQDRYAPATRFFLDDVYGAKGYPMSDQDVARVVPTMGKLLPAGALETVDAAIELDWLSERLDSALAHALRNSQEDLGSPLDISIERYMRAYQKSGKPSERERQLVLICKIGHELDRLARKPLISATLQLMRGPAFMAGLQSVQRFLECGFNAFKGMGGATDFLDTIAHRERLISEQLFQGKPLPFKLRASEASQLTERA